MKCNLQYIMRWTERNEIWRLERRPTKLLISRSIFLFGNSTWAAFHDSKFKIILIHPYLSHISPQCILSHKLPSLSFQANFFFWLADIIARAASDDHIRDILSLWSHTDPRLEKKWSEQSEIWAFGLQGSRAHKATSFFETLAVYSICNSCTNAYIIIKVNVNHAL